MELLGIIRKALDIEKYLLNLGYCGYCSEGLSVSRGENFCHGCLEFNYIFIDKIYECIYCPPGGYEKNGICYYCPLGYYCPGNGKKYNCGCDICDDVTGECLEDCNLGFYKSENKCIQCEDGYFTENSFSTSCYECEEGYYCFNGTKGDCNCDDCDDCKIPN